MKTKNNRKQAILEGRHQRRGALPQKGGRENEAGILTKLQDCSFSGKRYLYKGCLSESLEGRRKA